MALTIRRLNSDTSFLLTFEPVSSNSLPAATSLTPFRLLLDPWIPESCSIAHSSLCSTNHDCTDCVLTLDDLPVPDVVIISSAKSDQCHEPTLKQLPSWSPSTLILAEPAAARRIRSWKYFDDNMVETLHRWRHPSRCQNDNIVRLQVPMGKPGAESGGVTVAFISQKRWLKRASCAIGITYHPPNSFKLAFRHLSHNLFNRHLVPSASCKMPLTPELVCDETVSLASPATTSSFTLPSSPTMRLVTPTRSIGSLSPEYQNRGISVIFSPHGIQYCDLKSYATSHLLSQAALPLTALLHCFNSVSSPRWLGGNASSTMPPGQATACALGARTWISTHDGNKIATGLMSKLVLASTKNPRYGTEQVSEPVDDRLTDFATSRCSLGRCHTAAIKPTEVVTLSSGEEVTMTSQGIREFDEAWPVDETPSIPSPMDIYPFANDSYERLPGPW